MPKKIIQASTGGYEYKITTNVDTGRLERKKTSSGNSNNSNPTKNNTSTPRHTEYNTEYTKSNAPSPQYLASAAKQEMQLRDAQEYIRSTRILPTQPNLSRTPSYKHSERREDISSNQATVGYSDDEGDNFSDCATDGSGNMDYQTKPNITNPNIRYMSREEYERQLKKNNISSAPPQPTTRPIISRNDNSYEHKLPKYTPEEMRRINKRDEQKFDKVDDFLEPKSQPSIPKQNARIIVEEEKPYKRSASYTHIIDYSPEEIRRIKEGKEIKPKIERRSTESSLPKKTQEPKLYTVQSSAYVAKYNEVSENQTPKKVRWAKKLEETQEPPKLTQEDKRSTKDNIRYSNSDNSSKERDQRQSSSSITTDRKTKPQQNRASEDVKRRSERDEKQAKMQGYDAETVQLKALDRRGTASYSHPIKYTEEELNRIRHRIERPRGWKEKQPKIEDYDDNDSIR